MDDILSGKVGLDSDSVKAERRIAFSKNAMAVAMGQIQQVGMGAFTMWMFVGNRLNIWSVFFLIQMGTGPFRNLLSTNTIFSRFEDPGVDLIIPKLIYIAINLVGCAFFFYKLRVMGLMPITSSDWVSLIPIQQHIDYSSGL
jgi:ER membrane protein complex subunit 4